MEKQKKQDVESHSLTSEFVPYHIALRLKALGFNEPCLAYYPVKDIILLMGLKPGSTKIDFVLQESEWLYNKEDACTAPTWQSSFRWFRDKYQLLPWTQPIYHNDIQYYTFKILDDLRNYKYKSEYFESLGNGSNGWYDTNEEAQEACLLKLCEIVESKKD